MPPCECARRDSKGSLRAALSSLSAAGAPPGVAGFSAAFTGGLALALLALRAGFGAGFAPGLAWADAAGFAAVALGLVCPFAAAFAVVWPVGFAGAGFAAACVAGFGADFAGACVAGFEAGFGCCAAWLLSPSLLFAPVTVVIGFAVCARRPGTAAAIKIPSPRFIAERIVRSFPLRVSQPYRRAWLQREPRLNQQAW